MAIFKRKINIESEWPQALELAARIVVADFMIGKQEAQM
jgi:hypothetical protein